MIRTIIFSVAFLVLSANYLLAEEGKSLSTEQLVEYALMPLVTKEAANRYRKDVLGGIPKLEDVESITVEVFPSHDVPNGIASFEVPAGSIPKILDQVTDCEIDQEPILAMWEAGAIVITKKNQRLPTRIYWFEGAKSPLSFSLKGVRCIGKPVWLGDQLVTGNSIMRQIIIDSQRTKESGIENTERIEDK